MKPVALYRLAFLMTLGLGPNPQALAQAFDEPKPEVRPFRNKEVERAAKAAPVDAHGHSHGQGHAHGDDAHGVETESLFGFTLGSSTEPAGTREVAFETVARFGKRGANYSAVGQKLEFAYGVTDRFTLALGLLGDYHRVTEKPAFSGTVEEVRPRYIFNGFGGEIRYNFLERTSSPFGMTLHLEPSLAFSDEASGLRGRKYGSENKLIFDREIIKDTFFAAFNLTHEMEVTKEKGAAGWERGSVVGASVAGTFQVATNIFLGAETRYLRAYDGLRLGTYKGDAWYVGPTLSLFTDSHRFVTFAYSGLIGGKEKGSSSRLNLVDFERHQIRLKAGFTF
jgi:hypothetical protein